MLSLSSGWSWQMYSTMGKKIQNQKNKKTTCPGARETWIHCTSLIYQLCDLTQLLNLLPQTVPSFVIPYPSNTSPGGCEKAFLVPKGRLRKLSILKGVDNKRESFSEVKLDYKRFLFKCHFLWTFPHSLSFLLFPFSSGGINAQYWV